MAGRGSICRGNTIELTMKSVNSSGDCEDPTGLKLGIYPPGFDPRLPGVTTADAWVYDITLTSGGSGPYAIPGRFIEKTGTGTFKYRFRVPRDSVLGNAFDSWEGDVSGEPVEGVFSFVILEDTDTKEDPVGSVITKGSLAFPVSEGGKTTYMVLGSPGVNPTGYEGASKEFYENWGGNYFLPVGSTFSVPFGSITSASVVYICSTQDTRVYFNNSDQYYNISANGFFVLYDTEIYAILVESNSSEDADISVLLFGE